MRRFAAGLMFIVGVIAVFATAVTLGLTLTPQDSSVPATGDWEVALLPAGMAVCSFWAGTALWRGNRGSR